METSLYEIELKDGRIFRVFCANSTQKRKFLWDHYTMLKKGTVKEARVIANGIHTVKQWKEIFKTL